MYDYARERYYAQQNRNPPEVEKANEEARRKQEHREQDREVRRRLGMPEDETEQ